MPGYCAISIDRKRIGNIIKTGFLAFSALVLSISPLNAREMIILTCEEPPTNYAQGENIVGGMIGDWRTKYLVDQGHFVCNHCCLATGIRGLENN